MKQMKKVLSFSLGVLCTLGSFAAPAAAHGIWYAQRLDNTQLVLGEGYVDNAYTRDMVTKVTGYDYNWRKVNVRVLDKGDHVIIDPGKDVAVTVTYFDYGYWTKGPDGKTVTKPMNEVPGALTGKHVLKYNVHYFGNVKNPQPLPDLPYQLVPLSDPTKLNVGDELTVQALHNGKPAPYAEIFTDVVNHHTVTMKADAQGKLTFRIPNGSSNVIGWELTEKYTRKDPKAVEDKVFASLSFTTRPSDDD